jgi:hypothetical protein
MEGTARRLVPWARGLALLLVPASALAAPPAAEPGPVTVVLAKAEAEPSLREAILRVTAELSAAGFRVASGGCAPGLNAGCQRPWPENARAVAAVDFAWSAGSLAIETRVARAENGRAVRLETVVAGTPAPEPSVVAVRTTELVRAGVLAATRGDTAGVGASAGAPGARGAGAGAGAGSSVFVELGPALVQSGLGSAWGLSLCAGLGWRDWFAAGWLALPALGGEVSAAAGKAELRNEIAGLELGRRWRVGGRARPFVALGGGAYHLRVSGKDVEPFAPATEGLITPFAAAGAGLGMRVARHWELQADLRAVFLKTTPLVRIGAEEAARAGRPVLVAGVGVGFHP